MHGLVVNKFKTLPKQRTHGSNGTVTAVFREINSRTKEARKDRAMKEPLIFITCAGSSLFWLPEIAASYDWSKTPRGSGSEILASCKHWD